MTAPVQAGIYRHYKGPLYQVLHPVAHDANHEGRNVVVYIALQLDGSHLGPRVAVRTVEDFTALLHLSDRSICPGGDHCSHREARFQWLGPEMTESIMRRATGFPR